MNFEEITFRHVRPDEAGQASKIEQTCFPPNEACKPHIMAERVRIFPETFLVAEKGGDLIGFVIGLATDEMVLRDEFFTEPDLHDPDGDHIMILSVAVLPEYQRNGIAKEMMRQYLMIEKARGRKKSVLTCLEEKVSMYAGWGYTDLGLSDSAWGGELWHEMACELADDKFCYGI